METDQTWSLGTGEVGVASVIVTAYNQASFISDTLESVAAQTYRPLECVVVDDGSTDRTAELVDRFAELHASHLAIRIVHQENQGSQMARNAGLNASSGEFVQFLDGDDLLDSQKLEAQIAVLQSEAGTTVDVVYGDSRWLNQDGERFLVGDPIGMGQCEDMLIALLCSKWNPPFAYLCRRNAAQVNGPWSPELRIAQDVDYFMRMAGRGLRFQYLPLMCGLYRRHLQPRISDGPMALRARTMLCILRSLERLVTDADTLTPERRIAFADAYRRVSYWSYGLEPQIWQACLHAFIRLAPDLPPESWIARGMQPVLGIWRSEAILGVLRSSKRKLLARLDTGNTPFAPPTPSRHTPSASESAHPSSPAGSRR